MMDMLHWHKLFMSLQNLTNAYAPLVPCLDHTWVYPKATNCGVFVGQQVLYHVGFRLDNWTEEA